MEQRKSKQDREQKLHPIQCSATVLRQFGIDSANPNRRLVKIIIALTRLVDPQKSIQVPRAVFY
jgi:hypothetical protein